MAVFEHMIVDCPPFQAADVGAEILCRGSASPGRLFGVFSPQIGLSVNRLVILTEFPDAASVPAGPPAWLDGQSVTVEQRELWEPAPRPAAGESLIDAGGYYSHRRFDCRVADWPRFQQLSVTAWDNFEDVHDTRVVGFWRAVTAPAPGLVRVWLMAWYRDLAAWEGSRWYQASPDPAAKAAFERFRERRTLTVDSAVSILRRLT